jgi:hypothetical protein
MTIFTGKDITDQAGRRLIDHQGFPRQGQPFQYVL